MCLFSCWLAFEGENSQSLLSFITRKPAQDQGNKPNVLLHFYYRRTRIFIAFELCFCRYEGTAGEMSEGIQLGKRAWDARVRGICLHLRPVSTSASLALVCADYRCDQFSRMLISSGRLKSSVNC